ncbi:sulfatase-like hydrolase/transferase [Bradyrhizobium sp. RT10b]|uniref:sulfatase-like hydrolase/transferase n=1 Tax=Bradyrhizobium sp. RT10b TaxID=3156331 RepID=UPI00339266B3
MKRRDLLLSGSSLVAASALSAVGLTTPAQAQQPAPAPATGGQRPNIVFIMGDDIGWFNIGAYHQGIMASRTPNLDKLAAEGMRFTDYYAEASCTAGRANFITGELPIRTGLTTVGQAGSPIGMPAQAPTIATALKSMGYTTGQFGKNHLGDLNEFLPTMHGFDEFFGYLYHLDAMEDPAHRNYPQALLATVGPRNMVHSWATDVDDPTVQTRWGKIGKQKIEDSGPLYPKRMETVDDEILKITFDFIDKAKRDNKPFFVWLNPTRMHVVTHLSEKYENMRNSENGWSVSEGGFAQLDDIVGAVMKKLKDVVAAAGNPNIADELRKGKQLAGKTYKVYLDGYNQMDLITGKGPSARHSVFYFTEGTLSAVRIDDFKYRFTDQPSGWLGATVKVDWPILTNIRLDPFERTNMPNGAQGSLAFYNWFVYEFWRFQFVQQEVGKLAQTAIEFPPMQKGASFNLEAVKEQIEKAMQSQAGK